MSVEEGRKEIEESRDLSAIDGEKENRQEEMGTRNVPIESGDVPRSKDFEDRLANAGVVSRIFAGHPMAWARQSLEKLPVKMTLSNLGLFAVVLAVLMPRSFTYMLVYPVFRLVFGTLYPAYASYKAVRTRNVKEYVKWMMYWIVFALFTCAETFTDVFLSFWFPFYYEIKIILVLWLLSPATKGSSILYRRFVHPALIRREAEIDEALARATEQGYTAVLHLGTKGVNYATTVLMQTAIKNFPNVVPAALSILPASQSDSAISSLASPKTPATEDRASRKDCQDGPTTPRRRRRLRSEEPMPTTTEHDSDTQDVDLEAEMEDEDEPGETYFEQPHFKVPQKQPEKTRKPRKDHKEHVTRRQRSRTCKESVKHYEADFSDEVDY